ncbi:MAG: hypothetical protein IKJ24_01935 [Clostridia bacterium]|nr:hypothetical protein [Clostridia bacterium]
MKPSEIRAMREAKLREAEEAAKKEAEEAILRDDAAALVTEDSSRPTDGLEPSSVEQERVPYKRREGFFQAHVRLITFIITATLVMTVLGPLGIDMLVASKNNKGVTNRKDMEMSTVYLVHDNAAIIEWKNFDNFNYSDLSYEHQNGRYIVREYPIANSRLVLKVGGPDSRVHPEYIQLIDYRSGEYVNVLVDDPRDFVKQIED